MKINKSYVKNFLKNVFTWFIDGIFHLSIFHDSIIFTFDFFKCMIHVYVWEKMCDA